MTQHDDRAYLADMLLAAREAVSFVDGMTFVALMQSRLHQNAVLNAITTIGEAASQLGDSTREASPDIEWRRMVGMRNRVVHDYFDVNWALVWQTIQDDLPMLIIQLEPLVPDA